MEVAGAQRVMLSQARWFHAQGYSVSAVFFYDKQRLAEKWQSENSFPVHSLNAWRFGGNPIANYFRALGGMLRLFGMLRKSVDVVESFTPHSNLLGMPVAWLARVPVRIATHHGYIEASSKLMARVHGLMVNLGFASKLVAVSNQVKELAIEGEKILPDRIIVIENGIEALERSSIGKKERQVLRKEIGVAKNDQLLLTVGRLTVQKGHTVLLNAISQITAKIPNTIFAFAGDGHLSDELKEEAKKLGVENKVRFLGVRNDVSELLLASDIFVQPSLWEGLSLAMLEALLSGLPVLATEVEGVKDVIENGKTGFLVEAGKVDALSKALIKLLNNNKLQKTLGQKGKAHAEKYYGLDRMCQQYEDEMQSIYSRMKGLVE
jgi:glycosyltransferase involved in cell wall biosynthesis